MSFRRLLLLIVAMSVALDATQVWAQAGGSPLPAFGGPPAPLRPELVARDG